MRKKIAVMMVFALVAMVFTTVPMNVSAGFTGDVTILSDGTVDPADAPISVRGMIYTLTDDILGSITIQISGITLDGAGHTLEGSGGGLGIFLMGLSGVTIEDFDIRNFGIGIAMINCDTSTIKENMVSDTIDTGIYLSGSDGNTVKDNKVTNSVWEGIWLEVSSNNVIKDNELWNNGEAGIFLWFWSNNNIIKENKVYKNGMPFWGAGIFLMYSSNNNIICENDVSNKNPVGIIIWESDDNTVSENMALHNNLGGIWVYFGTGGNTITKNTIKKNFYWGFDGIRLWFSGGNTVSQNTISLYYRGILIKNNPTGNGNIINENTVRLNYKGIQIKVGDSNSVYHNNFINNDIQAIDDGVANKWDDGYPSGGNYWSDYKGKDLDDDGIGDIPYLIPGTAGAMDNYPLMDPW